MNLTSIRQGPAKKTKKVLPRCHRPWVAVLRWETWRRPPSWCWWSSQTACRPAGGCSRSSRWCTESGLEQETHKKRQTGGLCWVRVCAEVTFLFSGRQTARALLGLQPVPYWASSMWPRVRVAPCYWASSMWPQTALGLKPLGQRDLTSLFIKPNPSYRGAHTDLCDRGRSKQDKPTCTRLFISSTRVDYWQDGRQYRAQRHSLSKLPFHPCMGECTLLRSWRNICFASRQTHTRGAGVQLPKAEIETNK